AVENARSTLEQWFRDDDPRAAQMQATLKEMGGASVAQALPQIGNGLAAIEALKRKEGGA
ncbi:MAG: hypothetical protein ACPH5V_09685, partial [Alcanivorax sp.]